MTRKQEWYGSVALAVLGLATGNLDAQAIRGTVTESVSGRPVVGAMVRLWTSTEATGALFLTAADGLYRLTAPSAGTYYLQVERIGFSEVRSGPVDVGSRGIVTFDISVDTAPVRLEELHVEVDSKRCDLSTTDGASTQQLWDEARKALTAATWTRRRAGLRFRIASTERELDRGGRSIVNEVRRVENTVAGNSVRSLPPEDLVAGGYVRAEGENWVDYYAPDAEVLLSDPFLDTHCFSITEAPDGEDHLVGLAFDPRPGRDTTDVEGVLWMDRNSAHLTRVDFRYTGLGRRPGARDAGGEVSFVELSDGRWIVSEWFIRAPVVGVVRSTTARRGTVSRAMVTAFHEQGAMVLSVEGRGVSWRPDLPFGQVEGLVYDSIEGLPLAGAEVRMAGRGWRAISDEDGRFRLTDVPPGTYRIAFHHEVLDSLGIEPGWQEITVQADAETAVMFGVPTPQTMLALRCTGSGGSIVGWVRDPDLDSPIPGAFVEVISGSVAIPEAHGAGTNADGAYVLCGLPPGAELRVVARIGRTVSASVSVRVPEEGFARADLELRLQRITRVRIAPEPAARPGLRGRAVDQGTGEPVEGVLVELIDAQDVVRAQALSDGRGRFRLFPDEEGVYRLRTGHLAYADGVSNPMEILKGSQTVEVLMSPEAIELDEMVVAVEGRILHLERNGFYQRELVTSGDFVLRDDLTLGSVTRMSDVLLRTAGVNVQSMQWENPMIRRVLFTRAQTATGFSGFPCIPTIYVDGAMVRASVFLKPDDPNPPPSLDDLIRPVNIEAIEIYKSALRTPVQFAPRGALCGAIVIWSRRGPGG